MLGFLSTFHLAGRASSLASRSRHHVLRRSQLQEDRPCLGHMGRDCTVQAHLRTRFRPVRLCCRGIRHPSYLPRDVGGGTRAHVDVAPVVRRCRVSGSRACFPGQTPARQSCDTLTLACHTCGSTTPRDTPRNSRTRAPSRP